MNVVKETRNQFDPSLMVTVVDVTKGVSPDTLYYNLRDKDRSVIACDPSFEEYGDPVYMVPRFYAERLLANCGGRTHRLVSPNKLIIKVPNGRAGTSLLEVIACRKRADGEWHPMTEDELNGVDNENVVDSPAVPEKVKGVSKKAKTIIKFDPLKADPLKAEEDDINLEFEEPTFGDIMGN